MNTPNRAAGGALRQFGLRGALLALLGTFALGLILTAWLRDREVSREQIWLGTFVQITAYGPDAEELERAVDAAFDEVARVQGRFSRTGEGELGRLNRAPPGEPVPVSEELFDLLQRAQRYRERTRGAFDASLGALVDLWGFVQDWDGSGTVPSEGEIRGLLAQPLGYTLAPGARAVTRHSQAAQIDLGGIAKGYAVDRALETLGGFGVEGALVNAGGNVGVFGGVPESVLFWTRYRPFRVAIQHPREPGRVLGTVELAAGRGVATSGDYQRFFEQDGVRYHHVLAPETGRPARALVSATVIAPTATEADALSTGVFVLGPEAGLALVNDLTGIEAVLVTPAGEVLTSDGLDAARFAF